VAGGGGFKKVEKDKSATAKTKGLKNQKIAKVTRGGGCLVLRQE